MKFEPILDFYLFQLQNQLSQGSTDRKFQNWLEMKDRTFYYLLEVKSLMLIKVGDSLVLSVEL